MPDNGQVNEARPHGVPARESPPSDASAPETRPDETPADAPRQPQVRHVLVLPDRDAAQDVAEALPERFGLAAEPRLVRDALAGEDDAEDAQWLVVIEDPAGQLDPAALDELVAGYEGWREVD